MVVGCALCRAAPVAATLSLDPLSGLVTISLDVIEDGNETSDSVVHTVYFVRERTASRTTSDPGLSCFGLAARSGTQQAEPSDAMVRVDASHKCLSSCGPQMSGGSAAVVAPPCHTNCSLSD
jgi:hypothetical protein